MIQTTAWKSGGTRIDLYWYIPMDNATKSIPKTHAVRLSMMDNGRESVVRAGRAGQHEIGSHETRDHVEH